MDPQKTTSDYSKLHPRNIKRSDKSFHQNYSCRLSSNYFPLNLNQNFRAIYQYDYKLHYANGIQVQKDSNLYHQCIKLKKQKIQEAFGLPIISGQLFFSLNKLEIERLKCQIKYNDKIQQIDITLKLVGYIEIEELFQNDKYRQEKKKILQILNICVKNKLRKLGMIQLGKSGKYFQKQPEFITVQGGQNSKLQFTKGYYVTIIPWNRNFVVQIDTCSRILQEQPFHLCLKHKNNHNQYQKYIGQTLTTRYGKFKNYRIKQIHRNMTPQHKFKLQNGEQISFIEYYDKHYQIKIQQKKQPMIEVVLRTQKSANKKQKKEIIGYLVPQLTYLAGLKDEQRKQQKLMQNLAEKTNISFQQRIKNYLKIIEGLNKNENWFTIGTNKIQIKGYKIQPPKLYCDKPNQTFSHNDKDNRPRYKLFNMQKDCWFVYSISNMQAQNKIETVCSISKRLKGSIVNPHRIIIEENNEKKWIQQMRRQHLDKKNKRPKIIIVFLTKDEQKYYKAIKQVCTIQFKCPTQVIRMKTASHQKFQSIARKIILQIFAKMGHSIWKVDKDPKFFNIKNLKIMHCGIKTYKINKEYYLSFVGSVRHDSTKFLNVSKKLNKNQNKKTQEIVSQIFENWFEKFYENQKCFPESIIIYKEGLNEKQATQQAAEVQLPALLSIINKYKNCSPIYKIIAVNKNKNSKFYNQSMIQKKNICKNPQAGTFVIQNLDTSSTFQLYAQEVSRGAANPIKFTIIYQNQGQKTLIANQVLMRFTYAECFNYYNWEGTVPVPACIQYANKLSQFSKDCVRAQTNLKDDKNTLILQPYYI